MVDIVKVRGRIYNRTILFRRRHCTIMVKEHTKIEKLLSMVENLEIFLKKSKIKKMRHKRKTAEHTFDTNSSLKSGIKP